MRTLSLAVVALGLAGASTASTLPDRSFLTESEHALGQALPAHLADAWALRGVAYGYDVDHVDLAMTVDFSTNTIDAIGTLSVTITDAGLTSVPVDLNDALTVTGVTVDGAPTFFFHAGETITVTLGSSPPIGASLDIAVAYNGRPLEIGNKSMRFRSHAGTPLMFTLSTPFSNAANTVIPISHYWRPCKDVPDDKSTYSCALTVPDTMIGVSNGLFTGTVDNGDGTATYSWQHDYEVAPYLITLGVTNYVEIQDEYVGTGGTSPIRHYVWPEDLADATSDWAIAPAQMAVFADRFGEYPFIGDKFCNYETTSGPAVEHQTAVSMPNTVITGTGFYEWLHSHELAHMWWGNCLTVADWDHVWLSEGLASYSEAVWFEDSGGPTALKDYMENMDSGFYGDPVVGPPYVWASVVYDKGAWVMHMLRHILGDTEFFQMLRDYRAAHEFGNVVTDDLRLAAETAYGGDLSWFFDPWLYEVGRPDYVYEWASTPALTGGAFDVSITLNQVQSMDYPTYTMPIDVQVSTVSGVEWFVITNDARTQDFLLAVSAEPTGVVMDPDSWVLADFTELTVGVGEDAMTPVATFAPAAPNPLRGTTTLSFELSRDMRVALRIFDGGGRLVRTLTHGVRSAGPHAITWDGTDRLDRPVASGLYFARLMSASGIQERRIAVLR